MISKIKRKIPLALKRVLLKIRYLGFKNYCNSCNSHIKRFYPGGTKANIIDKLEIIGAGFRESDICPICKASYRQRLLILYLEESKESETYQELLHIAPEESLCNYFKKNLKGNYTCGDIEPERYRYYANPLKIDLTKIDFLEERFDLIVCNHVLEHIHDDKTAMEELYRVLCKNGKALLQVPISLNLDSTYEDQSVVTPEERLRKFGQKDHVRVYAMDYVNKLEKVGFKVEVIPAKQFSNSKNYNKLALDSRENLFICRKE